MAFLRCTQCGSKALVASSQCPKCAHPFKLLDARGERAKLKRCRSCGIVHRADTLCHWCGEVKGLSLPQWTSVRVDSSMWRSAAAVALMMTVAGGVWRFSPQLKLAASAVRTPANDVKSPSVSGDVRQNEAAGVPRRTSAASAAVTTDPAVAAAAVATGAAGTPTVEVPVSAPSVDGAAEEIRWTPAVARTWVNVRADASRGGPVVGVIKPAARAMLGTGRAGWSQVRSRDIRGWVDPRLFEADSLRTRGDL